MPYIIRTRKDIIDTRPIRIEKGPKSYSYRWKLQSLLDLNEDGQYVLPFSRRLVHIDKPLWPRRIGRTVPPGYEECGCIGCENKTYADHILMDADDVPENGQLHIEEVYVESDDDDDEEEEDVDNVSTETLKNNNSSEPDFSSPLTSHSFNEINNSEDIDQNENENENETEDEWPDDFMCYPPSPFAYDPYDSFDFEC